MTVLSFVLFVRAVNRVSSACSYSAWKRRLVLRHKLTMHTAFDREDNAAPAAITALLVSK